MSASRGRGARDFEARKGLWQQAIEGGRLREAQEIIREALAWAREHGEERQVDSALCAQAAVAIQLGEADRELSHLREIVLRSSDPVNSRLAAYHLAIHYEFAKNYKKSLFYGRLALDRSKQLGRPEWLASSHNQIANALLGESRADEACCEYERALELMPGELSVWRGRILNNLGYCRLLQGRHREAYAMLYESLRLARRAGNQLNQLLPRLDLCFAHLETGRLAKARLQGRAALALAEKLGEIDCLKNALYLLGEAANLVGDQQTALEYFSRLHRDFYPDSAYLPQFLLAVDVRKLVNLHA
jgi:tetratricopeptide (TPR) repeat protein